MSQADIPAHLQTLAKTFTQYPLQAVISHFSSLNDEYFTEFTPAEIGSHIQAVEALDQAVLCQVIYTQSGNNITLDILGYDQMGVFAVITGTLTSLGYDIHSGRSFLYTPGPGTRTPAPVFIDRLTGSFIFDHQPSTDQGQIIQRQINELLLLFKQGRQKEARYQLHRQVGSFLSSNRQHFSTGRLFPVDIQNSTYSDFTVLHITGQSTPAFLFSLSNALALRDMIIQKVVIQTRGRMADDLIYITDKAGRPVTQPQALDNLKTAIALIKQFTFLLPFASNYDLAVRQFDQFLDHLFNSPASAKGFLSPDQDDILANLAKILGSSTYIWEDFLRMQSGALLPLLRKLDDLKKPKSRDIMFSELDNEILSANTIEEKIQAVNDYKNKELLRIDLTYLVYPNRTFFQFSEELTALAEVLVNSSIHLLRNDLSQKYGPAIYNDAPCRFCVMALGKLGGRELGYASDLELVLIYEGENSTHLSPGAISNSEFFTKMIQNLKKALPAKNEGIFDIDLRLRPHGHDGPLASSLTYWEHYYGLQGNADGFEKQALIKMRPIYGERKFTSIVMEARDSIVYSNRPFDISSILQLRERQIEELTGAKGLNAKYSPGGLCEIEYTAQLLQLQHGYKYPRLRTVNTLEALESLLELDLLRPTEFEKLFNAYALFRRLINSLRMVRGNARDLELPQPGTDEYQFLCRRMGYSATEGDYCDITFQQDIHKAFTDVREFYLSRFVENRPPRFSSIGLPELLVKKDLKPQDITRILGCLNITNTQQAASDLRQIIKTTPHRDIMMAVLVLAQRHIKASPSPDRVVFYLERFFNNNEIKSSIVPQILSHPFYLERAIAIFGYGNYLSNILIKYPYFIHYISYHSSMMNEKSKEDYSGELHELLNSPEDEDSILEDIRIYCQREYLRIGIRDIQFHTPVMIITKEISSLAEAIVQSVYNLVYRNDMPLSLRHTIVALGKLGGSELNYSSDIDLVFICHDTITPDTLSRLEALNLRFIKHLTRTTSHGKLFRVDLNLRPYGAQGPLVSKQSHYKVYYGKNAEGWEFQAWLKARAITGDLGAGAFIKKFILGHISTKKDVSHIHDNLRTIRYKTLRSLKQQDLGRDIKQGPGGIRTIEFFVQEQQIVHISQYPELITGNTLQALDTLKKLSLIKDNIYTFMTGSYIFLRCLEHRIQMENMQQRHLLPDDPIRLKRLAKRMGFEDKVNQNSSLQLTLKFLEIRNELIKYSQEMFPDCPIPQEEL